MIPSLVIFFELFSWKFSRLLSVSFFWHRFYFLEIGEILTFECDFDDQTLNDICPEVEVEYRTGMAFGLLHCIFYFIDVEWLYNLRNKDTVEFDTELEDRAQEEVLPP